MAAQDVVVKNAITEPVPVQVVNDLRTQNAFQECLEQNLNPAFDVPLNFVTRIPAGKRLVIELVTAQVLVPAGERARLRLMTYLGTVAYNFDLMLTSQGQLGGQQEVLVGTHAIRVHADKDPDSAANHDFQVNVYRDNATTPGHALICVSGYLVDLV
jgi:hypothetical protein